MRHRLGQEREDRAHQPAAERPERGIKQQASSGVIISSSRLPSCWLLPRGPRFSVFAAAHHIDCCVLPAGASYRRPIGIDGAERWAEKPPGFGHASPWLSAYFSPHS
jgi:hypothetical protein